jgi:hypothetical protein
LRAWRKKKKEESDEDMEKIDKETEKIGRRWKRKDLNMRTLRGTWEFGVMNLIGLDGFFSLNYKLNFCQFSVQIFSTTQFHNLGFASSCGCACFSESSVCVIKLMFLSFWMCAFQKDYLLFISGTWCVQLVGRWVGAQFHAKWISKEPSVYRSFIAKSRTWLA